MKSSKKRKKKTARRFYSRGSMGLIYILLIVIILGAVLLSNGIFPGNKIISPPTGDNPGELIIDTPGPQRDNLQLDTLRFKKCGETAAVDFLVDNSGSMEGDKMQNLKSALNAFGTVFPSKGVLAMQVYSDPQYRPPYGYQELIPFSFYGSIKPEFQRTVSSMYAYGATHSKDAFSFAKNKISTAISDPRFKNQKFNIVFISDGIPETGNKNDICPGGMGPESEYCGVSRTGTCRCFDTDQDPTSVANEIKNLNVRIFTIGYINSEDDKFKEKLRTLMTNVASSPSDFYEAPISNQITEILKKITTKFCNI